MKADTIRIIEELRKLSDSEWEEVKTVLLKSNKQTDSKYISVEKKVYHLLRELGMPSDVIGFSYIRRAVVLSLEDHKICKHGSIVSNLYETIAIEFDTTKSRVERAIRHAIEIAFDRANPEKIYEIFGVSFSTKSGRPSNSEFIAGIVDYIQL